MNASDKKRLKILVALLVVLAVTWWFQTRAPEPPVGVGTVGPGSPAIGTGPYDAVELPTEWSTRRVEATNGPRRNIFQYGPEPLSEAPPPPPPSPEPVRPTVFEPQAPPPPPPPPPIPFEYNGYSRVGDGPIRAYLFDMNGSRRFEVIENEVLLGRYRVGTVAIDYVEVEDLEFDRTERLPRVEERP